MSATAFADEGRIARDQVDPDSLVQRARLIADIYQHYLDVNQHRAEWQAQREALRDTDKNLEDSFAKLYGTPDDLKVAEGTIRRSLLHELEQLPEAKREEVLAAELLHADISQLLTQLRREEELAQLSRGQTRDHERDR